VLRGLDPDAAASVRALPKGAPGRRVARSVSGTSSFHRFMTLIACPDCGSPISGAAGVCARCMRSASAFVPATGMPEADPLMHSLQMWVGDRWHSHYRGAFERLLHEDRTGLGAGWTWNWAAALVPFWFFYRGLYREWLLLLLPTILLNALGLAPLAIVMRGYYADRMLFNRAMADIGRSGLRGRRSDPLPVWFWAAVIAGTAWTLFLAVVAAT
jgi:hypothetical protein